MKRARGVIGGLPASAEGPTECAWVLLDDQIMEIAEAAAFLHVSEDWLHMSDCPRASLSQEAGKRGPVRFLKSQLILYVYHRLSHRLRLPVRQEHAA